MADIKIQLEEYSRKLDDLQKQCAQAEKDAIVADTNYNNLVNEFKGKITYQTFLNSIKSLYMPMLSKDYIEKITIPEFRNFQILPKNAKLNSEYQEEEDEDEQNKLIKRINCKVGVFLIGFLILLICSILLVFKFD